MQCEACKQYRSKLHKCRSCKKQVCCRCSTNSRTLKARFCCYPGDENCHQKAVGENKQVNLPETTPTNITAAKPELPHFTLQAEVLLNLVMVQNKLF